jgi:cell division protein FtsQ
MAPAPAIDPRIRQRRIEVRRREGRRRLYLLLAMFGVVVLFLAAWGATRSPLLDVDHVRIGGAQRTTSDQLLAASRIHRGMAMIDIDEGAAVRRIEALPWVARATVHRQWPGAVVVGVTERLPVAAAAGSPGSWVALDVTGRVLATVPAPPPDQPALAGVPPAGLPGTHLGGAAGGLLRVAAALPTSVRARVAAVALAEGGQVELRLRPTGTVRLGPPEDLAEKLLAVETVLGQVDLARLAVLDVRVPQSPIILLGV